MRVLFVPVSSPRGSGEYARALSIATELSRMYPGVRCHFALSEEAPYARDCPFPATLMPSSPTFHTPLVRALITQYQPTLVVFDNAGRTAQLQAARLAGARVVFISSRPRQRRRAYRLRWLRLVDRHWIAYPQFIAGPPTRWERLKASLFGRELARYADCLIPESTSTSVAADYVLVLTGGVADHRDFAAAPHAMARAAIRLASENIPVMLVGAPAKDLPVHVPQNLQYVPRLSVTEMGARIRDARVVLCNGGDTLMQVLALARPCIAVAMARDQVRRLERCAQFGVNLRVDIDPEKIFHRLCEFWSDESSRSAQCEDIRSLSLTNGMRDVVEDVGMMAALGKMRPVKMASLSEPIQ